MGGLYANCLSSGMYLLDAAERVVLAVKAADGRVPVAATDNLGNTCDEHVTLCRRIAETGVDVVMLLVPELRDNDAERLHTHLCMMELVEWAVRPVGIKHQLGQRGIPIVANTRRTDYTPCSSEVLHALECWTGTGFTADGELKL